MRLNVQSRGWVSFAGDGEAVQTYKYVRFEHQAKTEDENSSLLIKTLI